MINIYHPTNIKWASIKRKQWALCSCHLPTILFLKLGFRRFKQNNNAFRHDSDFKKKKKKVQSLCGHRSVNLPVLLSWISRTLESSPYIWKMSLGQANVWHSERPSTSSVATAYSSPLLQHVGPGMEHRDRHQPSKFRCTRQGMIALQKKNSILPDYASASITAIWRRKL